MIYMQNTTQNRVELSGFSKTWKLPCHITTTQIEKQNWTGTTKNPSQPLPVIAPPKATTVKRSIPLCLFTLPYKDSINTGLGLTYIFWRDAVQPVRVIFEALQLVACLIRLLYLSGKMVDLSPYVGFHCLTYCFSVHLLCCCELCHLISSP